MRVEEIKKVVKESYGKIAKQNNSCCIPVNSCCGSTDSTQDISKKMGYTDEELKSVPANSNLGLGCGNPVAIASLKEGEIVLDLGSGAGFDCFLAANKVGKNGRVFGVDMTPEMIEKARENAKKGGYENVKFGLGEIEDLPVADNSVDVVISNCVINLSPDKRQVFREAFRVLKPGGRLMISDLVLLKELPYFIKNSVEAYIGCLSGAMMMNEYIEYIKRAGFQDIRIIDEKTFPLDYIVNDANADTNAIIKNLEIPPEKMKEVSSSVISIKISGIKPNKKY